MEKPESANYDEFQRGVKFKTVGLPVAVRRLNHIAKDDITKQSKKAFEPIMAHRNRVIHFHHPEYRVPESIDLESALKGELAEYAIPVEIEGIVAEQCLAWYELHSLLSDRWKSYFHEHATTIDRLHGKMLELRPFLRQRYEKLEGEIADKIKAGIKVHPCPSCGFKSCEHSVIFDSYTHAKCLVCMEQYCEYRFACPEKECNGTMILSEYCGAECESCEQVMGMDNVVVHLQPPAAFDARCPEPNWNQGQCPYCESNGVPGGSVVKIDGTDNYLCVSCLENFDRMSSCEWCSEIIAGDLDEQATYWLGCQMCDGHGGWDGDDD